MLGRNRQHQADEDDRERREENFRGERLQPGPRVAGRRAPVTLNARNRLSISTMSMTFILFLANA